MRMLRYKCVHYQTRISWNLSKFKVWFRDLAFRAGVYGLRPSEGSEATFAVCLCASCIVPIPTLFFSGLSYLSPSSYLCRDARGSAEGLQSYQTSGELSIADSWTTRCTGVGLFYVTHPSALTQHTRFAKLFMSHLDAEFKRQPVLSLRSLVTDQVPR